MKLLAKYKCRYCGEVFVKDESAFLLDQISHNASDYAENPHLGCADFIWYEVIKEETD